MNHSAAQFDMRFTPSKFTVLMKDWSNPNRKLMVGNETICVIVKRILGYLQSARGINRKEISSRIVKAIAAFSKPQHLWRRGDLSLSVRGRVYNAAVRSVPLYGPEDLSLRAENVKMISIFNTLSHRSIARLWCERQISNIEVRRIVI